MHSKLRSTFSANADGPVGIVIVVKSSGGMRIEINGSHRIWIQPYETSLRIVTPGHLKLIVSLAIERRCVTNWTRTFLCSRQVYKPTVGACSTSFSVNESCEKRHYYAKPIKHTNWINKKMILNYYKLPIIIYLLPSMEQLRPRKVKSQELLVLSVPYAPNTV